MLDKHQLHDVRIMTCTLSVLGLHWLIVTVVNNRVTALIRNVRPSGAIGHHRFVFISDIYFWKILNLFYFKQVCAINVDS